MDDVHRLYGHVRRQERRQPVHPGARQPVKRIAHGLLVRVESIAHATVGRGIVARSDQILHDAILLVVGYHHEQLGGEALGEPLRNEHVRGPSAAAEVERFLLGRARFRPADVQVAERPLERNRHGGLGRSAPDSVRTGTH